MGAAATVEQEKLYANNILKYRREIAGVADSTDIQAFEPELVKTWLAKPPVTANPSVPYPFVFVGIDPAGGGTQSDTAIVVSTFDLENRLVLLGAESVMMMDAISEKGMVCFLCSRVLIWSPHFFFTHWGCFAPQK